MKEPQAPLGLPRVPLGTPWGALGSPDAPLAFPWAPHGFRWGPRGKNRKLNFLNILGFSKKIIIFIMWAGFALASGLAMNGWFIFGISLVNLVPRSAANHAWYLAKFDGYGDLGRAKLIPGVW